MTKIVTEKQAAARMLLIRRENVNRHNENSARINLRTSQLQKQKVQTMQMELDRLHGSAIRGSGLDVVRINRMNTLKQIIGKYK
jgi:hypothetical protein